MRIALRTAMCGALVAAAVGWGASSAGAVPQTPSVYDDETNDIAADAYVYAYPLVLMEVTRRVMTNVARPTERGAPVNQFYHMRAVPDASFTDVVRPNADTLYSSMWFDVEKEPLVVSVPDSGARYYLLPMLDMWTDVFASPGKRTTGTRAQTFAIVGPDWKGKLPDGVRLDSRADGRGLAHRAHAGQRQARLSGRAQLPGQDHRRAAQRLRQIVRAARGQGRRQPRHERARRAGRQDGPADLLQDFHRDDGQESAACQRLPGAGAHASHRHRAGQALRFRACAAGVQAALKAAPAAAKTRIDEAITRGSRSVNDWVLPVDPIGTYGTDYAKRAGVARFGLGANTLEDAFYPSPAASSPTRRSTATSAT